MTWAGGSAGGADHILAALFAEAAGGDRQEDQLHPVLGRRRSAGGDARRARHGRHLRLWRVRGPDQGRQAARHRRVFARRVSSNAPDAPTLKERGINLELLNWRSVVAPPGLSAEQRKTLSDAIEKLVKSKEWAEILKARGWDDAYLGGAEFEAFLKAEDARVSKVMHDVGLVK